MNNSEFEQDDSIGLDEHPMLSPPLLMRSFLTIASSSVAVLLIYATLCFLLAGLFFPAVWEAMFGEEEGAGADIIIPVAMMIPWVLLHGCCCVGIGWITAKVAPFAPDKHGLILAIFLFIGLIQQVFSGDPNRLGMNVALTVVVPLAIAYGARLFTDRQLEIEASEEAV